MDNHARAVILRLLAALTDDEFAEIAAEARGASGEQIADLLRAKEYEQLQAAARQQTLKGQVSQALRDRIGG